MRPPGEPGGHANRFGPKETSSPSDSERGLKLSVPKTHLKHLDAIMRVSSSQAWSLARRNWRCGLGTGAQAARASSSAAAAAAPESDRFDLAVVGGGIVGLATAQELAFRCGR